MWILGTCTDSRSRIKMLRSTVNLKLRTCGEMPHRQAWTTNALFSCKLRLVSRLEEEQPMQSGWQSRCSRVVPTHEGGHHEKHRRNPQPSRRPILCRAAHASGGQHI